MELRTDAERVRTTLGLSSLGAAWAAATDKCLSLYYVADLNIHGGKNPVGVGQLGKNGMILDDGASGETVAHEVGKSLGLGDLGRNVQNLVSGVIDQTGKPGSTAPTPGQRKIAFEQARTYNTQGYNGGRRHGRRRIGSGIVPPRRRRPGPPRRGGRDLEASGRSASRYRTPRLPSLGPPGHRIVSGGPSGSASSGRAAAPGLSGPALGSPIPPRARGTLP
jgi:hypothetical protein